MSIYSTAISISGQATIPKAVREILGVKPGERISYEVDTTTNEVRLIKEKSLEERLKELDAKRTPEQKAIIKQMAGKTARELMNEWLDSPEATKYYKEKYGV